MLSNFVAFSALYAGSDFNCSPLGPSSLWSFWNKAKAQTVPEGYVLVPKDIPDRVVSCLENSRFHWGDGTRDYYTPIYSLMVEAASESGAEG